MCNYKKVVGGKYAEVDRARTRARARARVLVCFNWLSFPSRTEVGRARASATVLYA